MSTVVGRMDNADHDEEKKLIADAITALAAVAMTHGYRSCFVYLTATVTYGRTKAEPYHTEPERMNSNRTKKKRYTCQSQLTKKNGKQIRQQEQNTEANMLSG